MSGDRTSPRFEMIASTRRRWRREQKLAILAEVDAPGGSVSEVARRHTLHTSLRGANVCATASLDSLCAIALGLMARGEETGIQIEQGNLHEAPPQSSHQNRHIITAAHELIRDPERHLTSSIGG